MKKLILNISVVCWVVFMIYSCNDNILDQTPLDQYSDPVVWADIDLAASFLTKAYDEVEYGIGKGEMLGAMTDELVMARGGSNTPWNMGEITSSRLGTNRGQLNWSHFANVQRINLFLDNIDRVPDAYSGEERSDIVDRATVLKGEALFLRAWEYTQMMRSYGGLPILKTAFTLDDDFLNIGRGTFAETIEFIVDNCDEAAANLRFKVDMEMGRATKEAAMALKSRVLIFAASELTAGSSVVNELVGYKNANRSDLWTRAKNAAKEVIDLGTVQLSDFGAPDQQSVALNYFSMFKAKDLSDDEIIWGRMFRRDVGKTHNQNRTCGPNGINNFGRNAPMQQMVDSYQMKDGSDFFDHFSIESSEEFGKYVNISDKFTYESPYHNREPRFYASILFDSAVWQPRFPNLADQDPVGILDIRTREVIENGKTVYFRYGIDTRNGPVEEWNGTYANYRLKKFMDDSVIGRDDNNENIWIFMRYPEILLNYAEACLELGETEEAAKYINLVRNRAAMPDFTGDIWKAYYYERKIELFGEDIRWYDIRRWRKLDQLLPKTVLGIKIDEITVDGNTTTTWERIRAMPDNNFVEKMYWIPIEFSELQRAPKLEQNPGY